MARKHPRLLLERETKLHSLLPGWNEDDRLEASGVLALGEGTCCVVFDNLNRVARIHTSFEDPAANLLVDSPSPGPGFEDIAFDSAERRFYLLVEAMREADGASRARVVEFDEDFAFRACSVLDHPFECENRGFEGLAHVRIGERELLWALCEGNLCSDAREGGGRVHVFERASDRGWQWSRELSLPASAEFEDYSAIAIDGDRVAVVSQRSARLWCGRLDASGAGFEEAGTVYRFPKGGKYCNVEGVSWLGEDRLLMVSDRKKRNQSVACAARDQSIHIFTLPKSTPSRPAPP